MTKIILNIAMGTLEVEGSEEFVSKIYNEFKDTLSLPASPVKSEGRRSARKASPVSPSGTAEIKKARKRGGSEEPRIDKDLDLSGGESLPSLTEFAAQYPVKSNLERNVVFISYLKDTMGIEAVNVDQVFTCYDHMDVTYPKNLQQSIYDTSAKGWLKVPSIADLSVSIPGKNLLRDKLRNAEAR